MIASYIKKKLAVASPHGEAWTEALIQACARFAESDLADSKFTSELASGHDQKFWACISEALIARELEGKDFPRRSGIGRGPDFLVRDGSKSVWIEVTCPEPKNVPEDWLELEPPKAGYVPHEDILLRWTAAIMAKADKLLGDENGSRPGYLASGIVHPDDGYVIAVNGCRMRHGPFSSLIGISQFPVAAEVVFAIGPYQVTIDKESMEAVESRYSHRPYVRNRNGALVPAHTFLDPRYEMISAIWAVDLNGYRAFGGNEPMYVIHNPNALNPLSEGFLPADREYLARQEGEHFVLER